MGKKIAVIGNMNNNMFALTRYLRREGLDAHLFFQPAADHFHPRADTFSLDYNLFCHEVDWLDKGIFRIDTEEVKSQLSGYDFYIGQGDEAAFAMMAGIPMDIYFPYGSDIYKYAHLPSHYTFSQKVYLRLRKKVPFSLSNKGTPAFFLKAAIANANHVLLDHTNEEFEKKLLSLNLKGIYENISLPFIFHKEYEDRTDWDVHWKSLIDDLRKKNDFIVLYHGRQEWKTEYKNNDFTGKNTDHLIRGFADFIKNNPTTRSCLVMLEYGGDVKNSKQLVEELGIALNVVWFPKMFRKDLMYLIKNVDLCSGEFGRSYLTFGTVIEAMLMGKPVVHYREDKLYTDKYDNLYPLYNAKSVGDISAALENANTNPEERIRKGVEARNWVIKYFIGDPLQKIIQMINT